MLGDRLKELREEKELKQSELGEKLGLTAQAISAYETNKAMPTLDICIKICDLFDISIDYLACRTKERYNSNLFSNPDKQLIDTITKAIREYKK